jgi:muconolactone delta-isomerase
VKAVKRSCDISPKFQVCRPGEPREFQSHEKTNFRALNRRGSLHPLFHKRDPVIGCSRNESVFNERISSKSLHPIFIHFFLLFLCIWSSAVPRKMSPSNLACLGCREYKVSGNEVGIVASRGLWVSIRIGKWRVKMGIGPSSYESAKTQRRIWKDAVQICVVVYFRQSFKCGWKQWRWVILTNAFSHLMAGDERLSTFCEEIQGWN